MSSAGLRAGQLLDGEFFAKGGLAHTDLSDEELFASMRTLLQEGIHGLCFSAYVGDQSPAVASILSAGQVQERLELVAPSAEWFRTFSCTEGNEHALSQAKAAGVKTFAGCWIGDSEEKDERELEAAIEVSKAGHVDMMAIGNEVLLRGDRSEEQLLGFIHRFKEAVPDVPVGYVDAYFAFPQRPALAAACDFLPINCYPFWEGCPLEFAVPYATGMVHQVKAVAGDKPVIIAETGWPTDGPAEPGKRAQALYALNFIPWAAKAGVPLFWFSSFDEAWKVGAEGGAGAYWGFWDADGKPKYG